MRSPAIRQHNFNLSAMAYDFKPSVYMDKRRAPGFLEINYFFIAVLVAFA